MVRPETFEPYCVRSQVAHKIMSARHLYFGECKIKIFAEECLRVGPYSTAYYNVTKPRTADEKTEFLFHRSVVLTEISRGLEVVPEKYCKFNFT